MSNHVNGRCSPSKGHIGFARILRGKARRRTQRARRVFVDFASRAFATFALKRGVRACFNAKSAEGTQSTRRVFADFASEFFATFALKTLGGLDACERNFRFGHERLSDLRTRRECSHRIHARYLQLDHAERLWGQRLWGLTPSASYGLSSAKWDLCEDMTPALHSRLISSESALRSTQR